MPRTTHINSRDKGVRTERKFMSDLADLLPSQHPIKAQLNRNLEQYRRDKQADLVLNLTRGKLSVEIKGRANGWGIEKSWVAQSFRAAAKAQAIPVVVVKYDYKPYIVQMPVIALGHFFNNRFDDELEKFVAFFVANPEPQNYHLATISLESFAQLLIKMDS